MQSKLRPILSDPLWNQWLHLHHQSLSNHGKADKRVMENIIEKSQNNSRLKKMTDLWIQSSPNMQLRPEIKMVSHLASFSWTNLEPELSQKKLLELTWKRMLLESNNISMRSSQRHGVDLMLTKRARSKLCVVLLSWDTSLEVSRLDLDFKPKKSKLQSLILRTEC